MSKTKKLPVESSEWIDNEWRKNSSQIYKLCRLWSSDVESAKDLFQEVALRFCKSAAFLDRDRPMIPWFVTVARNSCRSHFRQSGKIVPESKLKTNFHDDSINIENVAESRTLYCAAETNKFALKHELDFLMSDLSETERMAVECTFIDGMPLCDVGRLLGVSKNAVGKRRAKALRKMESKKNERTMLLKKIGASPYLVDELITRHTKIS